MALVRTDYGLIYNTDGSLCATLLPEGGVAVTEGTTNIIDPKPEAWSGSNGGKVEKIDLYKMRVTNPTGGRWGRGQSSSFTVGNGETVTISGYIEGYAGHVHFQLHDITNDSARINLVIDSVGYYHGTWTNDLGNDIECQLWLTVYGEYNPAGQQYIIADKIQAEKKPYATPFVDGTRAAGRLQYAPGIIKTHDEIAILLKLHRPRGVETNHRYALAMSEDYSSPYSNTFAIRTMSNTNHVVFWTVDDVGSRNSITIENVWNDDKEHFIVAYMSQNPAPGRHKKELYFDGELVGYSDPTTLPDLSKIVNVQVGGWGSTMQWNSPITTICIKPTCTPEMVKTWHSLDAPFYDPREILDPAAKPIQVQGSGGYMVIDKYGEKWVRNSDGKTVFQFDVNTGNAEYGGELSAKVISANMFREIRNVLPYTHLDSLDESNPIEFRFYIPTETIQIVSIKLSAYGERFRGYTKSAKVGGAATSETWKYDGESRTEPGGGHTHTLETSSEQTSSRSHTIVVEGSTGTAGEHQHASAGEHQHTINTSSSETSTYGSWGGSTPESHSHSYDRVTGMREAGKHTHPSTGDHSHSISISLGKDTHSHEYSKVNAIRDVLPHTHQFYLPEHKHNIAGHSHNLEFGIYQDTTPCQCHLYCDNGSGYGDAIVLNNAPDTTTPYPLCNELDLTSKFSGTGWKSIKFTSTRRGRINFQLVVKVDLEA